MDSVVDEDAANGRLRSRPGDGGGEGSTGLFTLTAGTGHEAHLYAPESYRPGAAVLVVLHGAGGDGTRTLRRYQEVAEMHGILVLAPSSFGRTWDLIMGRVGPDVAALDRALGRVFGQYTVDRDRVAISGFSDGASYALSLGLTNGDLFTHVLAFSPGFVAPGDVIGTPRLYISHGVRDPVLPIHYCGRPIAADLQQHGYDIRYREFDGGHEVPPEVLKDAAAWLLD